MELISPARLWNLVKSGGRIHTRFFKAPETEEDFFPSIVFASSTNLAIELFRISCDIAVVPSAGMTVSIIRKGEVSSIANKIPITFNASYAFSYFNDDFGGFPPLRWFFPSDTY